MDQNKIKKQKTSYQKNCNYLRAKYCHQTIWEKVATFAINMNMVLEI